MAGKLPVVIKRLRRDVAAELRAVKWIFRAE
jgi:hypothetical protein